MSAGDFIPVSLKLIIADLEQLFFAKEIVLLTLPRQQTTKGGALKAKTS